MYIKDTEKFTQKLRHTWLGSILILVAGLGFTSCGDDNGGINWGGNGGNGTITPSTNITSRMETPQVLTDGSTLLLYHFTRIGNRQVLTYSTEFNKSMLHSRWVAFRFDGDTRARNASRANEPFADDPMLSSQYKIGSNGFGRGYDRGHLCASADRLYSEEANVQTFYMSNMSPQMSSFNQGYWITLEGLVQRKGRDASFSDTLYVVKGGTVREDQISGYVRRNNGNMAIPKYYYMALLKVKNGTYSSIAFWMEHKEYGYSNEHQAPLSEIRKDAVSVNQLERLTGINFFPNLPDDIEEVVEDQLIPSNWGL